MKDKVKLHKVANLVMGQSPDSTSCNDFGLGMPFLQGSGDFGERYPVIKNYCLSPKKIAPKESILISVRAPVGDINLADKNLVIGRGLAGIIPKKIDRDFLFYSIDLFKNQLNRLAQGTTFEAVNSSDLQNFEINFFHPDCQQKTARILRTIDAVIDNTQKALAKYQVIKKGMMHDLFTRGIDTKTGRLRPSYKDVPELYKESALGMIPKNWYEGKLIDSASEEHYGFTGGPFGSDLQTKHYTNSGVQVIQLQNIGDGEFINKSVVYTSNKKADELRSCNIYPSDIIIAKMADPVARACIIPDHAERFVMASDGIRLRVDTKKHNTLFIKESINNKYFRRQAVSKSTGTTRERIGLTELKNIKVKYPKLDEQNAIAKRIGSIDSLIRKESKNLIKHQKIKKGLMQDLLTGKVEVKV